MLYQVEGFDHYGSGNFATTSTVQHQYFVSNGFTVPTATFQSSTSYGKRAGSLGVLLTAVTGNNMTAKWIEKDIRPEQYKGELPWTEWQEFLFLRFAFRFPTSPSGRLVFFTCGDIELSVGTDWFIYVQRGSEEAQNSGYMIELNIWNFIEAEFNEAESCFRIWLNDYMAYEIENYTVPTLEKWHICARYATGGSTHGILHIDDFSMNDASGDYNNTRLGKTYVQTRYPTSDDVVEMTPNSGSNNYSRVSQATPDNDSSYVYSNVPGATDLYKNTSAIDAIDDLAVCAVVIIPAVRMTEPDSLSTTAVVKSGESIIEGGRMKLKAASYTSEKHIFEYDPSTNARWVPTDVEAASFGVRILDKVEQEL